MAKGIYKFFFDCGRMGNLQGIFVADSSEVESIIGTEVYFGEVLGKHSEISGPIEEGEITLVTEDKAAVKMFIKYKLWSGYNPFNYIDDSDDEDDLEEDDEN